MRPCSQDLRERILATVARGEGSLRELAERFLVEVSMIVRLLKRHRRTGSVEPSPHAGGRRPALGDDDLKRLRESFRERPDATLDELRDRLGVDCGRTTVARAFRLVQLPRNVCDAIGRCSNLRLQRTRYAGH